MTDTNAAGLMRIWNQPESAAVEAHTLDKLSTAPWRLFSDVTTTNHAVGAPLLRVLLEDCVQRESYMEIRGATNQPGEIAFAIKLPAERAALWQTNLAAVLDSITGVTPQPIEKGWKLMKSNPAIRFELRCVGGWVILGIGRDQNALFGDFLARILKYETPVNAPASGLMVEFSMEPSWILRNLGVASKMPFEIAQVSFDAFGVGEEVQTRGTVEFSAPSGRAINPWNLPTNIMRERLLSFTAVRGIAPLLKSTKVWQELKIPQTPDQLFAWSSRDIPLQMLFAATSDDPTNIVKLLADPLTRFLQPRLAAKKSGHLEMFPETPKLIWTTIPFATPFLEARPNFVLAGLLPNDASGVVTRIPSQMLQVLRQTNLVYYDWEATGPRLETLFQGTQLIRFLFRKAQLPADSAASLWILANTTNLSSTVTTGMQTHDGHIRFTRRSTVGMTAGEIHILADWLTSPDFPTGLNTFRGKR